MRYGKDEIVGVLKQIEAGRTLTDLTQELVSRATLYAWRSKYGGMDVGDIQQIEEMREENRSLRHAVACLTSDKKALKAVIEKNGWSL